METGTRGSTVYQGRDRRLRWPVGASPGTQTVVAAAVAFPTLLVTAALIARAPAAAASVLDAVPLVWIVSVSCAALGLHAVWRSTGLVRDGWVGGALAVAGLAPALGWHLDRLLGSTHPLGAWPSGLAASLAASVLVVQAGRSPSVDTKVGQREVLGATGVLLLAAVAVHVGLWSLGDVLGGSVRIVAVLAILLFVGAVPLCTRGLDRDVRRALVLLLPASAAPVLLHEVVGLTGWSPQAVLLALLVVPAQAVGAALVLHLATVRFAAAVTRARGREGVLLARLDGLWVDRRADSARRHEARGALAAVALANTALLESAAELDEGTRRELVDGVVAELRRISALLAPDAATTTETARRAGERPSRPDHAGAA